MIFEEHSTRTRCCFDVGMAELGGCSLYLKQDQIHLGTRESLGDNDRIPSHSMVGIMVRTLMHKNMTALARHANVPVSNGLADYYHPPQFVHNLLTKIEPARAGMQPKDFNVTFIGDTTHASSQWMFICTILGMVLRHTAPKKYPIPETLMENAQAKEDFLV